MALQNEYLYSLDKALGIGERSRFLSSMEKAASADFLLRQPSENSRDESLEFTGPLEQKH